MCRRATIRIVPFSLAELLRPPEPGGAPPSAGEEGARAHQESPTSQTGARLLGPSMGNRPCATISGSRRRDRGWPARTARPAACQIRVWLPIAQGLPDCVPPLHYHPITATPAWRRTERASRACTFRSPKKAASALSKSMGDSRAINPRSPRRAARAPASRGASKNRLEECELALGPPCRTFAHCVQGDHVHD